MFKKRKERIQGGRSRDTEHRASVHGIKRRMSDGNGKTGGNGKERGVKKKDQEGALLGGKKKKRGRPKRRGERKFPR